MTSSSSPAVERGLDTMLLVYSLLQGHPAAGPCQQFVSAYSGWFTSPLVLFEAKNILSKVYSVSAADATKKLVQFAAGPVLLLDLGAAVAAPALQLADMYDLDLTDAILLQLARQLGAGYLATEDQQLGQVCAGLGITPVSPLAPALRQQVAAWEALHLAPKGLPRVLRRVHEWLARSHSQAAQDFWSQTSGGSHLP
jgi:predicted nucleic acid-binding protein